MMRWFRAFLPKEERFFDLFDRHAQTVIHGSIALQSMLNGGEETPVYCQRVNQFENDADNITREVLTAVRRTFITPFDRGDIKNLITSMDDAIDQMQQTAKAVILCEVRTFEPPLREMGTLVVECGNLSGRAWPLLQSIATIVSTRVLRPQYAVFWAAFFNFVAFTVFGLHVAQTVGTGIIDPAIVDARVIFAALIGAIVWNLVTWGAGIPSSSSHALI